MPTLACQRCQQPLALPASTSSPSGQLSSGARALLAPAAGASRNATAAPAPLSRPLAHTAALQRLLAAPALRHPLCKECTDAALKLMAAESEQLRAERDALAAWQAEVKRAEPGDEHLHDEIRQLEDEAELVTQGLREAERDRLDVEAELRALEQEERELEGDEQRFWAQYSELSLSLAKLSSQRDALQTAAAHDAAQLARLQQTNVYNDAFSIGHDGGFATINGLRLGRLPGSAAPTEWREINAAWGQACLLLDTLARKCGVVFEDYRLCPKGSFSTIEKLAGDKAVYELYGSGDWQIGRLLQSRRFDHGMVAFLECLRQLAAWACARDAELRLPHAINKDRIGEASIRLQFGSDETWTRALRHVLLTLKVLLSWACRRDESSTAA